MQKRILVMSAVGSLCVLGEIIKNQSIIHQHFQGMSKKKFKMNLLELIFSNNHRLARNQQQNL
jgi:hypothetical protein